ncbi:MAG TPA: hypothetical protein DCS30_04980 [Rhizobiales bacterium]|nr:hypothetical protein [Hyphomicrobiales bacterium]
MSENLPPLHAVRAFEQAGRFLNLSSAAQELGVSPGAISQQVSQLEKWIGCKLFRRTNRGLEFTKAGQEYYATVSSIFDALRKSTSSISRPDIKKTFVVSVTASFAMKWLMPRLQTFREEWSDVEIKIKTTELFGKFDLSDGDVGIRYGLGDFGAFKSTLIARDRLLLVSSPDLFPEGVSDDEISYILDAPFLADRHSKLITGYPSWHQYLDRLGLQGGWELEVREFSQHWMVIEAAANGEGVALVKECLVKDEIRKKRLQVLGAKTIEAPSGYYLVHLAENINDPVIRSFRKWLLQELKSA